MAERFSGAAGRRARAGASLARLRKLYPGAACELDFAGPLQLLVATILSAQCTDKRVNAVTKPLFRRYKTAADFARAPQAELEAMVRPTGFFRAKARAVREAAAGLVERFGGRVPKTMEELLTLRGVARKTANVILGSAYGVASGVVVDTHVKRLAFRLGLSDELGPEKIEADLMALLEREDWIFFGHAMVWHGRRVCHARGPGCPACGLRRVCPKRGVEAKFRGFSRQ